jgi:tetratricopeptide (TPR) repeat protein
MPLFKKEPRYSPALYSYLKRYQEDPKSRVFAPLAEAYRKAGLVEEAIEIAREGLRNHPNFIGGRVALARALFDRKSYDEVIDELAPVIQDAPDNLAAQRLLAESFLIRGRVAEALGCYKMVLYYAPQDSEVARIVEELEIQAYEQGALVLRTDPPQTPAVDAFEEKPAAEAVQGDPGLRRQSWARRVELLQTMLQRVERYRSKWGSKSLSG